MKKLNKLLIALTLVLTTNFAFTQNVGIGTQNPKNKLHIVDAANPLRLEGLQNYIASDSAILITTADSGVVRYVTINDLITILNPINTDNQTLFLKSDSICITNGNCVYLKDLVDSLETLTVIRNTDSTIVYYDEDGDSTFINVKAMIKGNETITSIRSTDSTIIYYDENGDSTFINVKAMIKGNETITSIRSTDSTIIYYDENGDSTIIPISINHSVALFTHGPNGFLNSTNPFTVSVSPFDNRKVELSGTILISNSGIAVLGRLDVSVRPNTIQYLPATVINPEVSTFPGGTFPSDYSTSDAATLQNGTIVINPNGFIVYVAPLIGSTIAANSRVLINGFYLK